MALSSESSSAAGSTLADEQIEKVTAIVSSKLDEIRSWADEAKIAAEETIAAVGVMELPTFTVQYPTAPTLGAPVRPDSGDMPAPTVDNDPVSVAFEATSQLAFPGEVAIPDPQYGTPVPAPDRPTGTLAAPPTAYPTVALNEVPDRPDLVLPEAPVLVLPELPELQAISIADMPVLDIEPFAGELDSTEDTLAYLDLRTKDIEKRFSEIRSEFATFETAYAAKEASGMLQTFGSSGPPALTLEGAAGDLVRNRLARYRRLMDPEVDTVERELARETRKVTAEWAARNFSIAPGMLVAQVDELELEARRKVAEMSAKANDVVAKEWLDDQDKLLAFYVELEQFRIEIHLESVRRLLEEEKLRVRIQMENFNALLDLYKSRQQAVGAHIDAYNAELEAVLKQAGAYRTLVEGAIAETAENEARVSMFRAQLELLKAQSAVYGVEVKAASLPLEAYNAQLVGIKANAETVVANIASYREAIRGYAAAVDAATSEVDAYAAQVQANGSMAGVAEANARAYAVRIQEAVRANNVYRTFAAEQSDVLNANLQTFRDAANTNESFVRAQAAKVGALVQLNAAQVSAFETEVRGYAAYNKALAEKTAAAMSHSMVAAENVARAQALANQAQAETDKINAGALAGKAQALAGLAQGAMSALHVSAYAQASGGTSSSFGYNRNWTVNWGGSTRKSESKIQRLTA